jgi:hypothetical protein
MMIRTILLPLLLIAPAPSAFAQEQATPPDSEAPADTAAAAPPAVPDADAAFTAFIQTLRPRALAEGGLVHLRRGNRLWQLHRQLRSAALVRDFGL